MAVEFFDRYSRGNSVCHRMPPRLKVVLTLATILVAALVPISHWPVHGTLACLLFVAHSLAGIPLAYLARRLALFLPLVLFMGLAAPLSRGFSGGWTLTAQIVVRSCVALLAGLWLVNTTPFDRLLAALRGLGMPRMFAALLAFMYRYIYVVFDELARMRTAQRARTLGRLDRRTAWKTRSRLVGMLLIRSMSRADRVHGAMCARGWRGEVRTLD